MIRTPKKLTPPLSGQSNSSQANDLEAMIARLDKEWVQLKDLLRAQEKSTPPGRQVHFSRVAQTEEEEGDLSQFGWLARVDVTPLEASAIVDKVEKLGEEARIVQRLARLERRNLGLTFYAIFCTLLFLGILISTVMMEDNSTQTMEIIQQGLRPRIAAAATNHTIQDSSFPTKPQAEYAQGP